MKNLTVIFLLMLNSNLFAQDWATQGTVWHYGYNRGIAPNITYIRIESTGDTTIMNQPCKILQWAFPDWTTTRKEYTYEINSKIYWYNSKIDTFTLLYDFGAIQGTSWRVELDDSCYTTVRVDSISNLIISGDSLKVFHITDSTYSLGNTIIERIGSTVFLFPDEQQVLAHCDNLFVDEGYHRGLRCYQDSIIGLYETGNAPSCTYVTVGIEENKTNNRLIVYPNPTNGEIQIKASRTSIDRLELLDLNGAIIGSYRNTNKIKLTQYPEGIYYLRAYDHSGNYYMKKIIKTGH